MGSSPTSSEEYWLGYWDAGRKRHKSKSSGDSSTPTINFWKLDAEKQYQREEQEEQWPQLRSFAETAKSRRRINKDLTIQAPAQAPKAQNTTAVRDFAHMPRLPLKERRLLKKALADLRIFTESGDEGDRDFNDGLTYRRLDAIEIKADSSKDFAELEPASNIQTAIRVPESSVQKTRIEITKPETALDKRATWHTNESDALVLKTLPRQVSTAVPIPKPTFEQISTRCKSPEAQRQTPSPVRAARVVPLPMSPNSPNGLYDIQESEELDSEETAEALKPKSEPVITTVPEIKVTPPANHSLKFSYHTATSKPPSLSVRPPVKKPAQVPKAIAVAILAHVIRTHTDSLLKDVTTNFQSLRDSKQKLSIEVAELRRHISRQPSPVSGSNSLDALLWQACVADHLISDVVSKIRQTSDFATPEARQLSSPVLNPRPESSQAGFEREERRRRQREGPTPTSDSGMGFRLYSQLVAELKTCSKKAASLANSEEEKLLAGFYLGLSCVFHGQIQSAERKFHRIANSETVNDKVPEKRLARRILDIGMDDYARMRIILQRRNAMSEVTREKYGHTVTHDNNQPKEVPTGRGRRETEPAIPSFVIPEEDEEEYIIRSKVPSA